MKKEVLPNVQVEFLRKALSEGCRIDSRKFSEWRNIEIIPNEEYGSVQVCLGDTRVHGIITAEIIQPFPDKQTEGRLVFNTEFSPMADSRMDPSKGLEEEEVKVSRMLERIVRYGRVLDLESLCIVAGEKVWCIRVDVRVLNDEGNVLECAVLAAICGLLHFRRSELTVDGLDVKVHSISERVPVPLDILHIPVCCVFALTSAENKNYALIDPNLLEQQSSEGELALCVNSHKEICSISKLGVGVDADLFLQCGTLAAQKSAHVVELIRKTIPLK